MQYGFWGARLFAGLAMAVALCGAAGTAQAQNYVNATVGGQVAPGIYGRVDIGAGAPPALLYQQPVLITRPPVYVQQAPVYMYVPPGHARKWSRHCAHYGACGQPVYFLKEPPRGHGHYHGDRRDRHHGHDWREREHRRDRDRRHDHGHRHGRGHD